MENDVETSVEKELNNIEKLSNILKTSSSGGKAMVWFSKYCYCEHDVSVMASGIASSTPNYNTAESYLRAAAKKFRKEILEEAIKLAREDFEAFERHLNKNEV